MISWSDFEKLDMRVGTIVEVADFPSAKKAAYQLIIDFGPMGLKKSSAQITDLYDKESLKGMQVIAVTNFPVKQIGSFFSECLVLGVYNKKNEVVLLQPSKEVDNGDKIG
jgi:tRNA-binding protein